MSKLEVKADSGVSGQVSGPGVGERECHPLKGHLRGRASLGETSSLEHIEVEVSGVRRPTVWGGDLDILA